MYYLDADMYLPPQVEGELPATPLHFEELEWNKEFTGDTIKGKPAWKKARCPGTGVSDWSVDGAACPGCMGGLAAPRLLEIGQLASPGRR